MHDCGQSQNVFNRASKLILHGKTKLDSYWAPSKRNGPCVCEQFDPLAFENL